MPGHWPGMDSCRSEAIPGSRRTLVRAECHEHVLRGIILLAARIETCSFSRSAGECRCRRSASSSSAEPPRMVRNRYPFGVAVSPHFMTVRPLAGWPCSQGPKPFKSLSNPERS